MNSLYRRAVAQQVYARSKPVPRRELLERREITVLGQEAVLLVERPAPGKIRASVVVWMLPPRGDRRGQGAPVLSLGADVHAESFRIAREAVNARGAATSEMAWGTGFDVEGLELGREAKPENDR